MREFKAKGDIKAGQAVYYKSDGTVGGATNVPAWLGIAYEPRSRVGRLAQRTRVTRWLYWRLTGRKIYVRVGG